MDDGKTRDFLGLPLWKPLYGFGDRLELRARMTTAVFARGIDRRALTGALPRHPLVKLHPLSPIVVIQADYPHCVDVADPDQNDYPYREVMVACVLQGSAGRFGAMWPLVLYLDNPIAVAAGREYHGFPKVPARVTLEPGRGAVEYTWSPRGEPRTSRVLEARWRMPDPEGREGVVARALNAAGEAIAGAVRATGVDADTVDLVTGFALGGAGEVWNLHQVPDLVHPRRAAFAQLTRFQPRVLEPTVPQLQGGFELSLPGAAEDPVWSLGRRFFEAGERAVVRKATLAFSWEATMHVSGGEVIDTWT
ncbi:MAG TPA: acetoacetate decarboxylase family protein [Polyangiaceae bacterium]